MISFGVEADKRMTFKRHLERYTDRKGLEGYGPNAGKWVQPNMPSRSA